MPRPPTYHRSRAGSPGELVGLDSRVVFDAEGDVERRVARLAEHELVKGVHLPFVYVARTMQAQVARAYKVSLRSYKIIIPSTQPQTTRTQAESAYTQLDFAPLCTHK